MLEIGETDLALTEEEIEVLFADYYEFVLPIDGARQIFEKTKAELLQSSLYGSGCCSVEAM